MNDSLGPTARAALTVSLTEKVARLVEEQVELAERRAELLGRQRRNDRDLADCRATARLFGLEVEIPAPDRDFASMAERELIERRRAEVMEQRLRADVRAKAEATAQQMLLTAEDLTKTIKGAINERMAQANALQKAVAPAAIPRKRPSLKDFLLERLQAAGPGGAKAAPLREAFERAFGDTIHEKTVGMTLYRMSKDGLVRRDGHTWFIADPPSSGEAVNPGGETPGPDNRLI